MRFRLVWAVTVPIAALFWPVVLTYTFISGERATAQVTECRRVSSGKFSQLNCTGTWRTVGGEVGSVGSTASVGGTWDGASRCA